MAKKYRVSILPSAELDFSTIYYWLQNRSPKGANRWLEAFEGIIQRIEKSPHEFAEASESDILNQPIKQALFKTPQGRTYRAIFIERDDEVFILRVRGPGQPDLQADEL